MRLYRAFLMVLTLLSAGLVSCGGGGGGGGTQPSTAPVITSFTLTPHSISLGQTSQLTAVFSNGTGRVEPGGLTLSSGIPVGVSPATTTTYVLTVSGASGGSVSQSQTLTVHPAPSITSFAATPWTVTAGGTVQLTAQFTGGAGIVTPGNLPILSGTPLAVSPAATTQYTLTVTPPAGTPITRTLTVNVIPAATISSFSATPSTIREGNSSQLSCTFAGGTGMINPGSMFAMSGVALSVTPTATTTYTLSVRNALGTTVTAQTTVTVIPLPTLTSTAPASIGSGQPMSFRVSGRDEFGAALGPFVLDHGPHGMAVTPAGDVTWTPNLPMFGPSMDVKWQVSVPSYPGVRLSGTTRVEDLSRAMPLRRTGTEIPVWNSGLVVTDLDGDGKSEMLIASRVGLAVHAWNGSGYEQQWSYPFMAHGDAEMSAVVSRDLNLDGKQEILFASGNVVIRLEGATRREAARFTGTDDHKILDLKLADLDRDGTLEAVCLEGYSIYSSTTRLIVLDAASLQEEWRSPDLGLKGSLSLGNVDGDPAVEIVTAGGYVFDGATKANEWAYGAGFGRVVATGDLDGDGVQEIVGMQDWESFRGYSAVLKSPIWEKTGFDFDTVLVADSDGDGKAEIYVGDGQWGDVTGYRYEKASNTLTKIFQLDSQDHGVTSIGIGDLDGDGQKEIAWGSGASSSGADRLVVASLGGVPVVEWTNSAPMQLDGPFHGGKLARLGTVSRLMFAVPSTDSGYEGSRLVTLDPPTGGLAASRELGSNYGGAVSLDIADFTGSGIDRALLTTANGYGGYFTAFDFASGTTAWTSAPDLGIAVATVAADLNGDGFPDMASITREGYVYAHDVRSGTLLWKSTGLGSGVDLGVADLDGDGVPELVALSATRLVAFRKSAIPGLYLESGARAIPDARGLLIADTDGDGQIEVIVLSGPSYSQDSKFTRLDRSLALTGVTDLQVRIETFHLEDLGNGRRNIVGNIASPFDMGSQIGAFDPRTGAEIWRSPVLWGTVPMHSLHYVDVDSNGKKEISFGTTQGMYLTR